MEARLQTGWFANAASPQKSYAPNANIGRTEENKEDRTKGRKDHNAA
jgi:hypothetical protein